MSARVFAGQGPDLFSHSVNILILRYSITIFFPLKPSPMVVLNSSTTTRFAEAYSTERLPSSPLSDIGAEEDVSSFKTTVLATFGSVSEVKPKNHNPMYSQWLYNNTRLIWRACKSAMEVGVG